MREGREVIDQVLFSSRPPSLLLSLPPNFPCHVHRPHHLQSSLPLSLPPSLPPSSGGREGAGGDRRRASGDRSGSTGEGEGGEGGGESRKGGGGDDEQGRAGGERGEGEEGKANRPTVDFLGEKFKFLFLKI